MKKVYLFFLAVVFIFASCNLPLINKGEASVSFDEETVERFLDAAKAVGGDYPVTIEVKVHGRIEKSQSRTITSKRDAENITFTFDVPRDISSDVEVIVSVDKSVILYRGVTKNVSGSEVAQPINVELEKVFELKDPKLVYSVNGKNVRAIRQDSFEISVVTEDGEKYPDCVKTTVSYKIDKINEEDPENKTVELSGSKSSTVRFSECKNKKFVAQINIISLNAGDFSDHNLPQTVYIKTSGSYFDSEEYVLYSKAQGKYTVVNTLDDLDYASTSFISNSNLQDYCFNNTSLYFLFNQMKSSDNSPVTAYQGGSLNPQANFAGNYGNKTIENGNGEGKALVYDVDIGTYYMFARKNNKNVVFLFEQNSSSYGYSSSKTVTLPFDDDCLMRAAVINDLAYIITYKDNDFSKLSLKICTLEPQSKLVKEINLREYCPLATSNENPYKINDLYYNSNVSYDILAWEEKVYVLYNEFGTKASGSYGSTNGVSRGALIEIDPSSNNVTRKLGWLDKPNKYFVSSDYPDFKFARFCPDEGSTDYFFGPQRFVALKPKKLVIQDTGSFIYVDDSKLAGKNINRVVEVDLERFCITSSKDLPDGFNGIFDNYKLDNKSFKFVTSFRTDPNSSDIELSPTDTLNLVD